VTGREPRATDAGSGEVPDRSGGGGVGPHGGTGPGAPGQADGIIEQIGRTFRTPVTPVTPVATVEGFVVASRYGPTTDWMRNVLAARSATLVLDGEMIDVDRPHVRLLTDFRTALNAGSRVATRVFGVRSCLVLPCAGT